MSDLARIREQKFVAPESVHRVLRTSRIVGTVGVIATIIGVFTTLGHPEVFLRAYLLGYMFWFNISLGCLAVLMVTHVTTAQWGYVVRRILEAAGRNIYLMAVLFLPILIGVPKMYRWADANLVKSDKVMQSQQWYLTWGNFTIRAIFYFIAWCLLAYMLSRWSWLQDDPPPKEMRRRFQNLAGAGLVIYAWTMTFASVDWMMSLDPHWKSSIYGFYVMAGQGLIAFAFLIVIATLFRDTEPLVGVMKTDHVHDMGKLMFAFLILWAYMAFSQGLIYWSGNISSEIAWYLDRTRGGWWVIGLLLVILHFAFPFALLLSQGLKRDIHRLAVLAVWMMAMRWIDLWWLIYPNFDDAKGHLKLSWIAIAATIGIGGLWVSTFFLNLRAHPLIAKFDPLLERMVGEEHGH